MERLQEKRVVEVVQRLGIARSRDFDALGINRKFVASALKHGSILKVERGAYASAHFLERTHANVGAVCKRIRSAIICLESAAYFHGLIAREPEKVWIAINEKARDASLSIMQVNRVWFSGAASTQGVVNLKVDGIPIRVYSPMKTIADLLKYREKLGIEVANEALLASVRTNQYSPYRLMHFARMCRVEKLACCYIDQVGSGRSFDGRQSRALWRERAKS